MFETWTLAVLREITSSSAIWQLERLSAHQHQHLALAGGQPELIEWIIGGNRGAHGRGGRRHRRARARTRAARPGQRFDLLQHRRGTHGLPQAPGLAQGLSGRRALARSDQRLALGRSRGGDARQIA
jgi:hypothetical protein